MAKIELANWNDTEALHELSKKTYDNVEPGFQVEGVVEEEQLYAVFEALRKAIPEHALDVVPELTYAYEMSHPQLPPTTVSAHIDGNSMGLAVHQNVSDTLPVTLATYPKPNLGGPIFKVDLSECLNIREGETTPGRLTVFSHSGYDWLLPTAHLFDRTAGGAGLYTRYSSDPKIPHRSEGFSYHLKSTFRSLADYIEK